MAFRMGLGRARHMETRFLWIQAAVRDKKFVVEKIHTEVNTADLGTKHVDVKTLNRLLPLCSVGSPTSVGWPVKA